MWGDGMDLMNKYPRLTDLEAPAARRIPKFVFAYLDPGTGQDHAKDNNRAYLDGIELTPQFMRGGLIQIYRRNCLGSHIRRLSGLRRLGCLR